LQATLKASTTKETKEGPAVHVDLRVVRG